MPKKMQWGPEHDREMLRHLADGLGYREIGRRMGISRSHAQRKAARLAAVRPLAEKREAFKAGHAVTQDALFSHTPGLRALLAEAAG